MKNTSLFVCFIHLKVVSADQLMEGKYHDLYPPNFTCTLYNHCRSRCISQNPEEHKTHHPENTPPSTVTVKKTTTGTMTPDKMAAMDQHMKAMQAMHEKMMAAKTLKNVRNLWLST
jgi:hypothetical protein